LLPVEAEALALGQPQFSKGQIHEDKFFGKQEIYRKEVRIRLPGRRTGAERLKLQVTLTGLCRSWACAMCRRCKALTFAWLRWAGRVRRSSRKNEPFASSPERTSSAVSETERAFRGSPGIRPLVGSHGGGFFGAGLFTHLHPLCAARLIPILSGIIAGEGQKVTRRAAVLVSVALRPRHGGDLTPPSELLRRFPGTCFPAALQNAWVLERSPPSS